MSFHLNLNIVYIVDILYMYKETNNSIQYFVLKISD